MTKVVGEEIFQSLNEYMSQDPLLVKCQLEVVAQIASQSRQAIPAFRLSILKHLLTDRPMIQRHQMVGSVVVALLAFGYQGMVELVDVAEKDVNDSQHIITEILIKMRVLQRLIIVPSILAQLSNHADTIVK